MFISDAMASASSAPQMAGSPASTMIMILVFILAFYFLAYKPQAQQAKKQKEIIDNVKKGDVIVCASGIIGKVKKVHSDEIVLVEISDEVVVRVERDKIAEIVDKKYYVKLK